jgi:hypothetical protein
MSDQTFLHSSTGWSCHSFPYQANLICLTLQHFIAAVMPTMMVGQQPQLPTSS